MTAKEKAEELVMLFNHPDGAEWIAKEHALIAVKEVYNTLVCVWSDVVAGENRSCQYTQKRMQYWQEVKQEIENL